MEIRIERDFDDTSARRVLVHWDRRRGPLLCLTADGAVSEQYRPTGELVWDSHIDYAAREEQLRETAYEQGFRAGRKAERNRARKATGRPGRAA